MPADGTERADGAEGSGGVPLDRAVIDRIVDDATAVLLVGPAEEELLVPVEVLPVDAGEGTWIVLDRGCDPPAVAGIDHDLTDARTTDLEARMARLRRDRTRGRFER